MVPASHAEAADNSLTHPKCCDTLRAKGFRNTDISVLFPQNVGSKAFGHEKGTKSAEGAVAGGTTGALIGLGIPEYQAKRYEGRMRKGCWPWRRCFGASQGQSQGQRRHAPSS